MFMTVSLDRGVSVFIMISGILFLNKEIPTKKLYTKYILRLVCAFFVWAFVYALFKEGTIINKLSVAVQGHYHMWFIPMIIGLYMCVPIIKTITTNEKRTKYYLLLSIIFAYIIPVIITLFRDFGNELIVKGINAIDHNISNMHMHMVLGFAGCFVLGYQLDKISLNKKQRNFIYLLGLLGFIFTISMTATVSIKTQHFYENYHDDLMINVLLEAIAVYTWFKYRKYNNSKINSFIQILSKYSFGAFLVHVLILEQLDLRIGLNTLSFNPIFSVIVISLLVFVISFVLSAILNHIPIVKKYLV